MNLNAKIGAGTVKLNDRNYIAQGGEAAVFKAGTVAAKIYHDPKKMLPLDKIKELEGIRSANVIKPVEIVYNADTGAPIGYTMQLLPDSEPLCKLFTKTFKMDRGITPAMMTELAKAMQTTVGEIHQQSILVVDLNELNVLVDDSLVRPFFIDTDSYQTPRHKATAIMESIRDRSVKRGVFTEMTDWYSWGILTFQLYIGVHPFKGSHPDYKPSDWGQRMEDGVSIFNKKAKMPPVALPLSNIPPRYLEWFKAVFDKNERSIPPMPDSTAPAAVPAAIIAVVNSTTQFDVTENHKITGNIVSAFVHTGAHFYITRERIWRGAVPMDNFGYSDRYKKALVCAADDGTPVAALLSGARVEFKTHGNPTPVGSAATTGMFQRNNAIYCPVAGRLIENSFTKMGANIVTRTKQVENISALASHVYEGMVIQDLLGKKYLTVPYALGRCSTQPAPVLDKHRIVDAKCERNVAIIIGESKGQFDRFIIRFARDFKSFDVRVEADIAYDGINMTVLENGVLISVSGTELQVDSGRAVNNYQNPPIDVTMKLYNDGSLVYFVNGGTSFNLKMT